MCSLKCLSVSRKIGFNFTDLLKHKMSTNQCQNALLEATLGATHLPHIRNLPPCAKFWFLFLPNGSCPKNIYSHKTLSVSHGTTSHTTCSNFLNTTSGHACGLHSAVCVCAAQLAHQNSGKILLTCLHKGSSRDLKHADRIRRQAKV